MLPRRNKIEVCQSLRASGSAVPVLMLTARDAVLLALQLPELGHCHFQLELSLGIRIIHATDDHRLP